jgi:glutathione S-transferase
LPQNSDMMTLRSSPASPFGRKVKIAAAELKLLDKIKIIQTDTLDPNDPLRRDNPLGKIPTLVTEDGEVIYDSAVIVEYLDLRAGGGKLLPKEPKARIREQTLHALCDGIMEAALLQVYEARWRKPQRRDAKWLEHHKGKMQRGLAHLNALPPDISKSVGLGAIALACALGYLDLRFGSAWRQDYPGLASWLATFEAKVPSFEATRMKT